MIALYISLYVIMGCLTGRYWARSEYYNVGFLIDKMDRDNPHGCPTCAFTVGFLIWPIAISIWIVINVISSPVSKAILAKPPKEYERRRLKEIEREYEKERRQREEMKMKERQQEEMKIAVVVDNPDIPSSPYSRAKDRLGRLKKGLEYPNPWDTK